MKCTFCGKDEIIVRGVYYFTNDGAVNYFCSSKCRKNALKLKRDKRKIRWTESYKIGREKKENASKVLAAKEAAKNEPVKKKA